jgi:acetate kinase
VNHVPFLKRHPFFEMFSAESFDKLVASATVRKFESDATVIGFGQPVTQLGVVMEGTCAVLVPDDQRTEPGLKQVATLSTRDMFGEMSLLTGEPATADVMAATGARLVLVPHAVLSVELAKCPGAIRFLGRTMTERLRKRAADTRLESEVERARQEARAHRSFQPTVQAGLPPRVLVLNVGSSSLKYDLFDAANPQKRARGTIERIGEKEPRHVFRHQDKELIETVEASDHDQALGVAIRRLTHAELGVVKDLSELAAVGHRVVHGGARYSQAVVINDDVVREIEALCKLAPLHNPGALAGIRATSRMLPNVPQVAVFDTAFHATLPHHAYAYGIPSELAEKHGLRRYGFHGTSHAYVAQRAAAFLKASFRDLRIITCHLGNGSSVCAIDHGRSVDTSMGLTPLEGLVMGTRSGDLDPGLVLHLAGSLGMTPQQIDKMLNKESGLLGISGLSKDMRELEAAAASGNDKALLAISVFCYRVKKYIGSYVAVLGGLDALVFTGGIGQGSAWIRARVCQGLSAMGIVIDENANRAAPSDLQAVRRVSDASAHVPVLVAPTDEEQMIARETMSALGLRTVTDVVRRVEDLPLPINTSARHAHLSQADVEALFGTGHQLTRRSDLLQPGQYACEETVSVVGPKGAIEKVRILGPTRKASQVEISKTDEFKLGIDAPIRASGDLEGSPGLLLKGTAGEVHMSKGVIQAQRHIHMSPEDALHFALRDMDVVRVKVPGTRSLTFGDVLVRVNPEYKLEMHIDTDEANAAEISGGAKGFLDGIQSRRN